MILEFHQMHDKVKHSPNCLISFLYLCVFVLSKGVTVMIASDIPIFLSVERNKHFCLESTLGVNMASLQYTVCVSQNITSAHQEVGSQLSGHQRKLPDTDILR